MENKNNKASKSGIGLTGLLTIVFIILKLCGVITWSWLWALSPTWIPIVLSFVLGIILLTLSKKVNKNT